MRHFVFSLLTWLLIAGSVQAQESIPERRLIVTRDMDFFGSDLQPMFDTNLNACQKLCLDNPDCHAFTYNQRSNACFPKSEISDRQPYDGAVSAQVVETSPSAIERAKTRAAELDFLPQDLLNTAKREAVDMGTRQGGGEWSPSELLDAASRAKSSNNLRDAIFWTGAALAQTDDPALWLQYGEWSSLFEKGLTGSERRKFQLRAVAAPINAYLRSDQAPQMQTALLNLSRALERNDQSRLMIPTLRLAESIGARADITEALDAAIAKYGFRIREHLVESDSATPKVCAEFTEPLVRAGLDYAPYVRLPDTRFAVTSDDSKICITGLAHGTRYTFTFRAGLPSDTGEALVRDVPLTVYVKDRAPSVAFAGRAYVLPKSADAALPIETVNLDEVELVLRHVTDRNLVRTLKEDYFSRPLSQYAERYVANEMAEEVWRGMGTVENALNQTTTTRLPLGDMLRDKPAGVYALTAFVPGTEIYDGGRVTQWFLLSDIGLTTLEGTDGLSAVVRSLSDARPLAGIEVALVSRSNRVLQTRTTNKDGLARFDAGMLRGAGELAPAMVTARRGNEDFGFLSLVDPAFDLSDRGVEGRMPSGPVDAFLATDRGAYRAGEVIHATALLRDDSAKAIADLPLTAVLYRPDGVEYTRLLSAKGLAGGHVFDLPLAASVPRGTWRLNLHTDPEETALVSRALLVEDFIPERIDFDLSLPEGAIDGLNPPLLGVSAQYLFGAPAGGLKIEGESMLRVRSQIDAYPGYVFGRHDMPFSPRGLPFPTGQITDELGQASLPLTILESDLPARPFEVETTVRIAEGSGRPVERSISRPLLPSQEMIGIRPNFDGALSLGATASFDILALGADLAPADMPVRWTINRVNTRYQWYQQYGNWNWEPITTRVEIASGSAVLGASPLNVETQVDWGQYEIVVERTEGAYVASSTKFVAGWYGSGDSSDTPDALELALDRPSYAVGDEVRLRIAPRYAGQALITVLSGGVIHMQNVDVPAGESLIPLTVTEDWGTGAYVTAQVIRPMDVSAGQNPARAMGLAHAQIAPGDKKLNVTLNAPVEVAPRGALNTKVRVKGLGEGEKAHLTLAAVDVGVLNITGFQSPDPEGHYFGQRRLGVELRDIYGRLIDGMNGAMGQVRSGGDAAAGLSMQSPPPSEELVTLFSGLVTVDATGTADVAFDLPDFNGTLRLMAVVWSEKGVGQAEADVLVRDPIVLSAALPRFLAPGDRSRLRLDLTHVKGPAGEMVLDVSAQGLELDLSGVPNTLTLAAGQERSLSIPVIAGDIGDHDLRITLATPAGQRLTKSLVLGVRANDPPQSQTRRFSLEAGQTFSLDDQIFAGLRPGTSSAMISAGPLARFDVPGLLASLDSYPYGCTEQVTSKALPLLYLSTLAEPLGIGNTDRIRLRVSQAITKILTRQASNGAFGLWRAQSGDFWLDAYVTDFLSRAKTLGYDVPDLAFEQAMANLRNRIAYAPDFDKGGEDIAYALFVLARAGQAAMGDLRYYADERADNLATPLAQAQLGAALAAYGDQRRADMLFAKAGARLSLDRSNTQRIWRADYGSDYRDRAAVLALAVEARSDAVDRNLLSAKLSGPLKARSTQDQAWTLMAAHALVQDPSVAGLEVDGAEFAGPFLRKIGAAELKPMKIKNVKARPIDVTLTTIGVPEGRQDASGYGYHISRRYFDMSGAEITGDLSVGDRLVAVVTVKPADKVRARLMIDDPLPAGLEIDNPTLLRAGDIGALDWLNTTEAEFTEFRSDRFLAAVDQTGSGTIQLAYILRAVSPGVFHHPAALVEDMYRPDYRATTDSGQITVLR